MEILVDGLTFDLLGFSPESGASLPEFVYQFDRSGSEVVRKMEGLMITAGPHLAGAENTMPVVRTMVRLAALLAAHLDDIAGIGWGPSRSVMGTKYFLKVANSWLEGGPFPALGLTAFRRSIDGGMVSEGLAFFTGQELRLAPELAADPKGATRLGIRLVNELVGRAPVSDEVEFSGPDGECLLLTPSDDRQFVRVRAG